MNNLPEIKVSRSVLDILRGLMLSEDPTVAAVAAQRVVEETNRLKKMTRSRRKTTEVTA